MSVVSSPAWAQGDGPRAYQFVPKGTHALSVYAMFSRGNQAVDPGTVITGAKVEVNTGVLFYAHPLVIGDRMGGLFGVVPFGAVTGTLSATSGRVRGVSRGAADIQIGWVQNLVGPAAATLAEYVKRQPGFAFSTLAKVTMPTGDYSSSRIINLGANRWNLQLGSPLAYYRGRSFIDAKLTTFEVTPTVTFFGRNDDPHGADTLEQKPFIRVEGHVTQNLSRTVWVSFDTRYSGGGATTTDGVDDDNLQHSFGVGGTVSVTVSRRVTLKASYGGVTAHNQAGMDNRGLRLVGTVTF